MNANTIGKVIGDLQMIRDSALYAAQIDDSVLLVAESLDRIRAEVKAVMQG